MHDKAYGICRQVSSRQSNLLQDSIPEANEAENMTRENGGNVKTLGLEASNNLPLGIKAGGILARQYHSAALLAAVRASPKPVFIATDGTCTNTTIRIVKHIAMPYNMFSKE